MKSSSSNEQLKKSVGEAAAQLVEGDMMVGVGTGSTARFFIEELGRRVREEGLRIVGVPTSFQSRLLCQKNGVPIADAQDVGQLDLAVDGADEVDPDLNLIKGGGAAHAREKVIAGMAKQFVVIVDESKLVPRLGTGFAVPVEIIPPALKFVSDRLLAMGGQPTLRMGVRKDGPVVTDNGLFVIDAKFDPAVDMRQIDAQLHNTPGVLETGLFLGMARKVLVGVAADNTVKTLLRPASGN
jgi:ribose 5-phosphate isomerase A